MPQRHGIPTVLSFYAASYFRVDSIILKSPCSFRPSPPQECACNRISQLMRVKIKSWHAIAQWRWDTGNTDHDEGDGEGDVCGICRVPYEGCCPTCKVPGDDCPLSEYTTRSSGILVTNSRTVWGECSHVFHMHCLLKWIGTPASKQQCPMDRRTWGMLLLLI